MEAGRRLPMFPLGTVLFPGALLPLRVFEPRYRTMLDHCLAVEPAEFGVVLIARGSEVGGGDERTALGTVARIEQVRRAPDGRAALVARGTRRLRVAQWLPDDPYPLALVDELDDDPTLTAEGTAGVAAAAASVRRVEALASELGSALSGPTGPGPTGPGPTGPGPTGPGPTGPGGSLWALCARLPVNALDRQRLLAADDPAARAALLVELADALADDLTRLLAGG